MIFPTCVILTFCHDVVNALMKTLSRYQYKHHKRISIAQKDYCNPSNSYPIHNIYKHSRINEKNIDENWSDYAIDAIDLIKDAALPSNGGEVISIFVSEAFAGFVSGLSFRVVSFAIGVVTYPFSYDPKYDI